MFVYVSEASEVKMPPERKYKRDQEALHTQWRSQRFVQDLLHSIIDELPAEEDHMALWAYASDAGSEDQNDSPVGCSVARTTILQHKQAGPGT